MSGKVHKNIFEYVHYLENTISELKAKNINKPEWYLRVPFKKTFCKVSNHNYSYDEPQQNYRVHLVENYEGSSIYNSFRLGNGTGWKYAIPLTKEEVLKYTLEEQEK